MKEDTDFEVLIIGGSYAGLSAAMSLGRSLRRVLIIDDELPCNRQSPHSHNLITQDGETPKAITQKAKAQVLNYSSVRFHKGFAAKGEITNTGFSITTATGETFSSRKLIFATGIKDSMPLIKGFEACWGISVVHCPYCHGYELRDKKTGIMANGERALHLASLINNLTTDISILTSGKANFDQEQLAKLNRHNIKIIETDISEIDHENGHIKNVVFNDDTSIAFDALYAAIPFVQHSDIPASLGCELTEHGYIKVEMFQKTTIDGIFACGDNSGMIRSVANAISTGNATGAMVNKELSDDLF